MDSKAVAPGALPAPDELRRVGLDGRPDYSSAGLATYAACNRIRQGISPGWVDVCTADLPGQEMSV